MKANPRALAVAVIAALAWAAFSGRSMRRWLSATPLADVDYGIAVVSSLVDLAVLLAALVVVGRLRWCEVVALSGLRAPLRPAATLGLWLLLPAAACAAALAPLAEVRLVDFAWQGVGAPWCEELGFRGLAVGALLRCCGWRFWPAALLPALLFGLAHFGQGRTPAEVLGVVAITGAGGGLFAWLYVRWGFNLWSPLCIHAGLNTLWLAFDLGTNAVGGQLGNVLRVGVIAGAIVLTLRGAPRADSLRSVACVPPSPSRRGC